MTTQLHREEAIAFTLWRDTLNTKGYPRNADGSMMDIWQLYEYWDKHVDQEQLRLHANRPS
jgi:hypothetical protein